MHFCCLKYSSSLGQIFETFKLIIKWIIQTSSDFQSRSCHISFTTQQQLAVFSAIIFWWFRFIEHSATIFVKCNRSHAKQNIAMCRFYPFGLNAMIWNRLYACFDRTNEYSCTKFKTCSAMDDILLYFEFYIDFSTNFCCHTKYFGTWAKSKYSSKHLEHPSSHSNEFQGRKYYFWSLYYISVMNTIATGENCEHIYYQETYISLYVW